MCYTVRMEIFDDHEERKSRFLARCRELGLGESFTVPYAVFVRDAQVPNLTGCTATFLPTTDEVQVFKPRF